MKHSKRYNSITRPEGLHNAPEAITTIKKNSNCNFDETVDIHFDLNILKKHTIRDTVVFPHSFGKAPVVLVFAKGEKAEAARAAGAEHVGDDDLVQKISDGWLDFDVAVATPDMMKVIARIAKILGTKGLMPSPKAKTVTNDVAAAVQEIKSGRKEYRANEHGVINFAVGKVSMEDNKLIENFKILYNNILKKRPTDLKGDYIKSLYVSSTMGKSIKLDRKALFKLNK